MKIGVVTEIKPDEYRVALTPAGARELVGRGHQVVVERGAGVGSSCTSGTGPAGPLCRCTLPPPSGNARQKRRTCQSRKWNKTVKDARTGRVAPP